MSENATFTPPRFKTSNQPVNQAVTAGGCRAALSRSEQVADVIDRITSELGPCRLWISSFSVADEFLRRLYWLRRSGHVTAVSLILDFKATNKTIKLWPFLSQVADAVALADNHSKVLLFMSEEGRKVAVVTSQNLTRGNRFESSVEISGDEPFDSLLDSFQHIVNNHSLPLSDAINNKLTGFSASG